MSWRTKEGWKQLGRDLKSKGKEVAKKEAKGFAKVAKKEAAGMGRTFAREADFMFTGHRPKRRRRR